MRTLASIVALFALAAAPAASEKIKMKSGKVLQGRATSYDAKNEVLNFRTDDGQDMVIPVDQLDGTSVYLVYSSVIEKDHAKGQLQLANFARDAQLFKHAARRYGYAAEADPSLKPQVDQELARLRSDAADFCLKNAKDAQAKNDSKEAQKWLTLLLECLPEERQAVEASALLEKDYTRERASRDDQLEKDHADLLQKDLKTGKEHYDRMIERTRDGLTARNASTAQRLWKGAISDGEDVLKELDKIGKKYSDVKVQEGVVKYRELTIRQMVDAHLHLASQYTVKSDFNDAMKQVNAALALDPANSHALAQRARIEQASNEPIVGWW